MKEEKQANNKKEEKKVSAAKPDQNQNTAPKGGSVYANKKRAMRGRKGRPERQQDEFEQKIVDLARVTRVMAGGKRMRFRACVVIGNRKGKIGLGLDKGADVTIAVNKAVNQAKKNLVDVPMVNETIPHEIYYKYGAGRILLKPARKGKGVIAGGAARSILELSGIHNISCKNLGTSNNVTVAKTTVAALENIKRVEKPTRKTSSQQNPVAQAEKKKAKVEVKDKKDKK